MAASVESDNDENTLRNALAIAMGGTIHTPTLKAFSWEESAKITEKLP